MLSVNDGRQDSNLSEKIRQVKRVKRSIGDPFRLSHESKQHVPWFQERLLSWFEINGRNFPWRVPNMTPYQIIVSEILLQRTTANAVGMFFPRFVKSYPTWESLASADINLLQVSLRPLGLWKQKSLVFKSLANSIIERGGGIPCSREELEQLPGIGQYIASAVMLVLCGLAEPLLDATMARLLERFFGPRKLVDIRYDPYLKALSHEVADHQDSLTINWAMLDLGTLVCRRQTPLCLECPVQTKCRFLISREQS